MRVIGLVVLRVRRPDLHRPYRAWGYPVTPLIFARRVEYQAGSRLITQSNEANVSVNAISPYATTQMTAEYLPPDAAERMGPEAVAPAVAWLASGEVSGEILVAGGGRVGRARMRTTRPVELRDEDFDWQRLASLPLDVGFPGAGEHFQDFIADSDPASES